MGMSAMLLAGFPPRFFGMVLGRAFGKGAGLTLGSAFLLVESSFQFGDTFPEFVDFSIALAASRAWPTVHGVSLAKRRRCSCAKSYLPYGFPTGER